MVTASAYRIVEQGSQRLVIVAPGSSLLSGWMALVLAAPLLAMLYFTSRSIAKVYADQRPPEQVSSLVLRYRLFGLLLIVGALMAFWAISYTSGSIQLSRATNLATIQSKMTLFLPAREISAPIDSIQSATLDSKPNSRRIRLLLRSGSDLAYPMWTDRAGQEDAVRAINRFLKDSPQGVPGEVVR